MSKYKFVKNSSLERPKNVSYSDFMSSSYGDEFIYEPKESLIKVYHFNDSAYSLSDYRILRSLKNTINYYSGQDELYNFNEYYEKPTTLICMNSIGLGSGLSKGSININIYLSGTLVDGISDKRQDGILYNKDDNKIGAVLYNEGFILINNTSSLGVDDYEFSCSHNIVEDKLRWNYIFSDSPDAIYYEFVYSTKNETPTNTYFIYANKNQFNHSNNTTYIESGSYYWSVDNDQLFLENEKIKIKNTVKSPFVSGSANFQKQTYITKIGLYDDNKDLIGVASLANPVKKTENREFLFKLKIDI